MIGTQRLYQMLTLPISHTFIWRQLVRLRAEVMEVSSPQLLNEQKKTKKKTKRRGPRLTGVSKQRRLANARERTRVHTLNANIDQLKDIIPLFPDEKPSKTETIRIAALYISHMTELLNTTEKTTTLDFESTFDELTFPTFNFDPFADPGGNHLKYKYLQCFYLNISRISTI